jgi:hypothetical protein
MSSFSESSESSVLDAILERDKFLGESRCVVCGFGMEGILETCYIIAPGDKQTASRLLVIPITNVPPLKL